MYSQERVQRSRRYALDGKASVIDGFLYDGRGVNVWQGYSVLRRLGNI